VAATRADDEDSEAGNGVRNGSLRSRPPPAGWIAAAALIDPHFLQGRSHSAACLFPSSNSCCCCDACDILIWDKFPTELSLSLPAGLSRVTGYSTYFACCAHHSWFGTGHTACTNGCIGSTKTDSMYKWLYWVYENK
jgi:hypothetical protein